MSDNDRLEKYYNFVQDSVVYIHDKFDWGISKHVIPDFKNLINYHKTLKKGKIIIDICSYGGYVDILSELLSLVEIAKAKGIIVETRAMSMAHSCGSILLASGTPGHRYASPLTRVLVHHASTYSSASTDIQLQREYDTAKRINVLLKQLLQKYTTIPVKSLTAMLSDDSYYVYGEDLLKFGIVDEFTYEL